MGSTGRFSGTKDGWDGCGSDIGFFFWERGESGALGVRRFGGMGRCVLRSHDGMSIGIIRL